MKAPFFRPGNWLLWISAAIIIRIIILAFFVDSAKELFPERMISGFAIQQNDYEYFLGPVDQYYETGIFQYEKSPGKVFAGRMPGYSSVYFVLRMIFDKAAALTILFSLQILLSAFCVYILAKLTSKIVINFYRSRESNHQPAGSKISNRSFYISFFIAAISIHTALFDIFTLAESFSVSAIILFFHFGYRYFESGKNSDLFLTGLFVAWAIFLRPFLGLIIVVFPLLVFFRLVRTTSFPAIVLKCVIFALPFMVFEGLWIYRNYKSLDRFIPLETSLSESYGERGAYRTSAISLRALINAWGGEPGEFYQGSEGEWFHFGDPNDIDQYIPQHAYYELLNKDSILILKKTFNASIDSSYSELQKDSLNMLASSIALRHAAKYKKNHLFRYYILNPVSRTSRLVFTNGTRLLPLPRFDQMNPLQKIVKLFYFALSMAIIIVGIVGMMVFAFGRGLRNTGAAWIWIFPIILGFTLVAFSDILEFRYYIGAYPVFIVFSTLLLVMIVEKVDRKYFNRQTPSAS